MQRPYEITFTDAEHDVIESLRFTGTLREALDLAVEIRPETSVYCMIDAPDDPAEPQLTSDI